jgi:hypothetical protein
VSFPGEGNVLMAESEARMWSEEILDKVDRIVACTDGRTTEQINMVPPVAGTNSLLVLAVHTMANVEEAILQGVLGNDVQRDRDSEFLASGSSPDEVAHRWGSLRPRLQAAMENISESQLKETFEHPRRGVMTGRQLLLVTATHASEHVGHAEITRDWIASQE